MRANHEETTFCMEELQASRGSQPLQVRSVDIVPARRASGTKRLYAYVQVDEEAGNVSGFVAESACCCKVKRSDLEIAAASWLAGTSPDGEIQVRFDIIDMLVVSADRALLRHRINAFSCGPVTL